MISNFDIHAVTSTQYAAIVDAAKHDAARLRSEAMADLGSALVRRLKTLWVGLHAAPPPRRARRDPMQLEIGAMRQPTSPCAQ